MAADPAFLFYPGDYLKDTQVLSEKAQVAYDRIMCEHMRNICITQAQLKFFTKRLTDEEREELLFLLKEVDGGFQIEWVAESIVKRRAYSESRRNNRKKKETKKPNNISKTYVPHMENENEDINRIKDENGNEKKKSAPKKEKTIFKILQDDWSKRYLDETELKYQWNKAEGATLNQLITKLRNLAKQQHEKDGNTDPVTDDEIVKFWDHFMDKMPEWYSEKADLKIINSKFNAIIAEIKRPYNKGKKLVTDTYKAFGIDV